MGSLAGVSVVLVYMNVDLASATCNSAMGTCTASVVEHFSPTASSFLQTGAKDHRVRNPARTQRTNRTMEQHLSSSSMEIPTSPKEVSSSLKIPKNTTTAVVPIPTPLPSISPTVINDHEVQHNKWCNNDKTLVASLSSKVYSSKEECLELCVQNAQCGWVGIRTADKYCEFWTLESCHNPEDLIGHDIYNLKKM